MLWRKLSKFKSPHVCNVKKKKVRHHISTKNTPCCVFSFPSLFCPPLYLTVNFLDIWGGGIFYRSFFYSSYSLLEDSEITRKLLTWWHSSLGEGKIHHPQDQAGNCFSSHWFDPERCWMLWSRSRKAMLKCFLGSVPKCSQSFKVKNH